MADDTDMSATALLALLLPVVQAAEAGGWSIKLESDPSAGYSRDEPRTRRVALFATRPVVGAVS